VATVSGANMMFYKSSHGVLPVRWPFWRTPKESCKGLGSVNSKINTQPTLNFAGSAR